MRKLTIRTKQKQYDYMLGEGVFDSLPRLVNSVAAGKRVFVVADNNVFVHWRTLLSEQTMFGGREAKLYILPQGEASKSFLHLQRLLQSLLHDGFNKDTLLLAIGGGVTGDLAGFAASIYNRGIAYAHIPTTLLAMIDSSVGGKTGINFAGVKNNVGTISQPEFVLADTRFLRTLPEVELLSAYGELIKYAFISHEDLYKKIVTFMVSPSITRPLLVELIYLCASFKASVVVSDESEKSARKILNFGHTFGHALEAVSDMKIPHGLAVAYGLLCALNLSARLGVLKAKARSDFIKLPLRFADATVLKFSDPKKLVRAMAHDKKNFNGKLQFVLLAGIGEVALNVNCPNSLVEDAIELANEQYRNAMR